MNTAIEAQERTPGGKFQNRPGPGRPSKKLLALQDRYRGESQQETLKLLADDVGRLTGELADADAAIEAVETEIVERSAPLVKHREEIASTLARARVCVHYLADPAEFEYTPDVRGQLESEIARLTEDLKTAEAELCYTPPPDAPRSECLGSDTLWHKLRAYEKGRDRVEDLQKQKAGLERELEQAMIVAAAQPGPSDSNTARRQSRREGMADL